MELSWQTVRAILREVLEDEMGFGKYEMTRRYQGGKLLICPADPAQSKKELPLEVFFKKITGVREKLRVLEQKINNHPKLDHEDKAELQMLITRAYGSLTTFNILFQDKEDHFEGVKGGE